MHRMLSSQRGNFQRLADHGATVQKEQQGKRMNAGAGELHWPEPQILTGVAQVKAHRHQRHQNQTRWNRRAFEVFYLAGAVAQLSSRDVVARQSANAAGDEKYQDDDIECVAQTEAVSECCGGDAAADALGEGVDLLSEK